MLKHKQVFFGILAFLFFNISCCAQFSKKAEIWADSIFNALDTNQRLGQLFMVAAYSNKDEKHYQKIDSLVKIFQVGGLIFFQGGPKRQALLTNRYQSQAKVPLMIGIDGEWGLNMRLDSTMYFPKQMTLGAIADNTLIYKMGKEVALHCKRMGIHVNFAPVVDVNVNADNPVIGVRSFGENKIKVAEKGIAYMKGMQNHGVMANAKHFPGHGDTDADSHYSLPVINHDKKRLDDVELYPFKRLIKDSLLSMMVAHIHIPAYDNRPNMATTLSPNVVTDLLKNKLKFNGLIFTDALNMKGVSKFYQPGEVDVMALIAGNDVLLFAEDVPTAILKIKSAISEKKLNQKDLDDRVKKILKAKYWSGLSTYAPLDTAFLYQYLNSNYSKSVREELYSKAITIVKNEKGLLPIKELGSQTFASLSIGLLKNTEYQEMLNNYADFKHFGVIKKDLTEAIADKLIDSLSNFSRVIISLHDLNNRKKENYGISDLAIQLIKKLQSKTQVVVVHFGNVYALKLLEFSNTLICGYEDNEAVRRVMPQIIFGAYAAEGKLPVSVSPSLKIGVGINTKSLNRLVYSYPESIGISELAFSKVDSIINESIKDGSTPGAQIQIVKDGSVIYRKNFGYYTYDKSTPVSNNTLYDLASVTKTAATMQAIMFLHDWKQFDPDKFASDYLPELKGTNKSQMILRDMMVHQAGMVPFIEHWRKSLKNGQPDPRYYSRKRDKQFSQRVSNSLFSSQVLEDSIWKWTVLSKKSEEKADTGCYTYKYSDLTFYFLKRIAEKQLNQPIDNFLIQNFYKPLGLRTMTFNPIDRNIPLYRITPTEEDKIFRNTIIQGTVHDQGSAMTGGVAGHAGIFSNANDLAILGQMNINGGEYGGISYLKASTISEFTRQQYSNNRRAMGWDRPFPPEEISLASPGSFGHTGFTGTAWWMDPESKLVFVFLSNRTYPFADNKRITNNSVRTKLLNAVYEALGIKKLIPVSNTSSH